MKFLWMGFGVAALIAGIVGILVPVLPTAPFVLLAAFCFSRGDQRWELWLLNHPRVGPMILQWRRHHIIPLKAKLLATLMMTISSITAWFTLVGHYRWLPAAACAVVAAWIWHLPHQASGPRAGDADR